MQRSNQYRCLFFTLFFLSNFSLKAQVKFVPLNYDEALKKAVQNRKLLFIVVKSSDCVLCNDIAEKVFLDTSLGKIINKNFIPFSLSVTDAAYIPLINNFEKLSPYGVLFADVDGNILNKFAGISPQPVSYYLACTTAIANETRMDSLAALSKEYESGNRDTGFLENYIIQRKRAGLNTDTLLDQYVSKIAKDSLASSLRILNFILSASPIIGSEADKACHTNKTSFMECWYRMDRKQRSSINRAILSKSLDKAIREKNDAYAYRVANAAKSMYGNTGKEAEKRYSNYLLDYYWGVKDTASFLSRATTYVDQYFANATPDSLKKADSIFNARKSKIAVRIKNDADALDTAQLGNDAFSSSFVKSISSTLNKYAWRYYKIATRSADLRKASYWSLKSLQIYDKEGTYWDTYARLLYKLGDKQEGIANEEKALELTKNTGYKNTIKEYEQVIANMKANRAVIGSE